MKEKRKDKEIEKKKGCGERNNFPTALLRECRRLFFNAVPG